MKIGVTERGDAGVYINEVLGLVSSFTGVILITKAPQLVLPYLAELDKLTNKSFIVHSTITGYGGTALEPGVAPVPDTFKAYKEITKKIGSDRSVLRVDPIIPSDAGMARAYDLVSKAEGRIRISFFDAYPHALDRMTPKMREGIAKVYGTSFHAPLSLRLAAYRALTDCATGKRIIEVCGEPGMVCSGCVSALDLKAMKIDGDVNLTKGNQRAACACLVAKTEMLTHRGQCKHGCLYCYWK